MTGRLWLYKLLRCYGLDWVVWWTEDLFEDDCVRPTTRIEASFFYFFKFCFDRGWSRIRYLVIEDKTGCLGLRSLCDTLQLANHLLVIGSKLLLTTGFQWKSFFYWFIHFSLMQLSFFKNLDRFLCRFFTHIEGVFEWGRKIGEGFLDRERDLFGWESFTFFCEVLEWGV